jgi:UDP-N-acetylmuramoylalanine--D-glutamate ligase
MRLAIGNTPAAQVIGITGSQGKSTTTAMVHHILASARPELAAQLGGNIGGSLLDSPPAKGASIVLEFSSFMLHWLATDASSEPDRFTPGTAVITNISPNHLDWHETYEHYAASKSAICASTTACNAPRLVEPEEHLLEAINSALRLSIPGEHNLENARLAVHSALTHLQVRGELNTVTPQLAADFASRLGDFQGLPHRLNRLGIFGGVECINDSKSTTPESTLRAVGAFEDSTRVHLLAGGYDKGSDISPIADLAPRLAGLYGIGTTGPRIAEGGGMLCGTIDEAVRKASGRVQPGDVLLLSPGCASWDQFTNYEARGEEFEAAIRRTFGAETT